jgi:hypothetical protein
MKLENKKLEIKRQQNEVVCYAFSS